MEYLHLFKTKSEHDAFYFGNNYKEPWMAYIKDEESLTYNKPHDYSKDYFTIYALDDGNVYFKYVQNSNADVQRYMEYSKDGGETWVGTTNINDEEVIMTIPLLTGEKALVRGDNDTFGVLNDDEALWVGSFFYSDIEFNVSGNIMSLIHGENFIGEINVIEHMFENLFFDTWGYNVDGDKADCMIVNAKNLILPATTLSRYCYSNMFFGCTSLVTAPKLPATTLAERCYSGMFQGCSSLIMAPELPATTLVNYCYCYMFQNCTNLNYIKAMFTTTPSNTYTQNWVNGVAATGTFFKNSAATWNVTGVNGIPSGWSVETASA